MSLLRHRQPPRLRIFIERPYLQDFKRDIAAAQSHRDATQSALMPSNLDKAFKGDYDKRN